MLACQGEGGTQKKDVRSTSGLLLKGPPRRAGMGMPEAKSHLLYTWEHHRANLFPERHFFLVGEHYSAEMFPGRRNFQCGEHQRLIWCRLVSFLINHSVINVDVDIFIYFPHICHPKQTKLQMASYLFKTNLSNLRNIFCCKRLVILTIVLFAIFVTGCTGSGSKGSGDTEKANIPQKERIIYRSLDDLAAGKVATYTGSTQERALEQKYPKMHILRMDDDVDMIKALLSGICDAIVLDDYTFKYYTKQFGGVEAIDTFGELSFGVVFKKGKNTVLREQFNDFLKEIKSNGILEDMRQRWIEDPDNAVSPEMEMPQSGTPVIISIAAGAVPFQFYRNGELTGFEIELCKRFSVYIQRPVEFKDSEWAALITSIAAGSDDMAISALNITSDRAEAVDFSESYYTCSSLVGVRLENTENYIPTEGGEDHVEKSGMFESLKKSFYRNIVEEDRYKMILSGLKLTAFISLMAGIIGTLFGAVICWMKMHRNKSVRLFAGTYISIMQGTPVLVFLMFMFYVVFAGTPVNAVWVSIITFAMNFSAYAAEMFRTSIEGIDKGQTEAGLSLGYTPVRTFTKFIMPQALANVLPVYKGEVISLIKDTSIVGFIAVQDLTKVGDIIRSRTFDAFFPLIMVAVLYFALAWIFATALGLIGPKRK